MTTSYKSALGAISYGAIVVALIVAKLAGHLHWSWWLVLSPLWGPVVLAVILIIIAVALFAGAEAKGENPFQ